MLENIIVGFFCVAAAAAGIWAYWVDHNGDEIIPEEHENEEKIAADKRG